MADNPIALAILSTLNERGAAFRQASDQKARVYDRLSEAFGGLASTIGDIPNIVKKGNEERDQKTIDDTIAGHFANGGTAEGLPKVLGLVRGSLKTGAGLHYLATQADKFDTAAQARKVQAQEIGLRQQTQAMAQRSEARGVASRRAFAEASRGRMGGKSYIDLEGMSSDSGMEVQDPIDVQGTLQDWVNSGVVDPEEASTWYDHMTRPELAAQKIEATRQFNELKMQVEQDKVNSANTLKERQQDLKDSMFIWQKKHAGDVLSAQEKALDRKLGQKAEFHQDYMDVRKAQFNQQTWKKGLDVAMQVVSRDPQMYLAKEETKSFFDEQKTLELRLEEAYKKDDEDAIAAAESGLKKLAVKTQAVVQKAYDRFKSLTPGIGGAPQFPETGKPDIGTKTKEKVEIAPKAVDLKAAAQAEIDRRAGKK